KMQQSILLNVLLTPLLLFYFYQVNFLTVLFNLMVVPYFNWGVMPVTFINIVLFSFTKKLAPLFEHILELGEKAIGSLSNTQLGLLTFGKINWWQCLILILITMLLIIALRERPEWKFNKKELSMVLISTYLIFFGMIQF